MIKDILHQQIISKKPIIVDWFLEKGKNLFFPFYSSIDIRDSGLKVAPVDANLFPAGFNNICEVDQQSIPSVMAKYIGKHYQNPKTIILLTEEHTSNPYYWDNVFTLKQMLNQTNAEIIVCVPGKHIQTPTTVTSARGHELSIGLLKDVVHTADLILSNNDFSLEYTIPDRIPLNPSPKMGWRYRKKSSFFNEYNQLATEFAKLIDTDPWHLTIKTTIFKPFNPDQPESLKNLKASVDLFLKDLSMHYKKEPPFAFLKNNSGTYGLGITSVQAPQDIENWNYKTRKKMKASKGGRTFDQLIIQEGIPTIVRDKTTKAEPVIYMLGSDLIGGFLRTHTKKGDKENLNSPGAVYKKLCISDLKIQVEGKNEENVYGWVARLATLALAFEIQHLVN